MPKSSHRIRKQRWLVRCDSAPAAFRLRQRLHADWQEYFLPAFERAFDQEFGGEEVIHLATINLRLRFASEETMFELLAESLQQHLARQVRDIVFQRPHRQGKLAVCRKSTPQQNRLGTLLRYLHTGNVPWEAAGNRAGSLAEELKATCRAQWLEVQTFLRAEQLSAAFYFRLLQLIAPSEVHRTVRGLLEDIPPPQKAPVLEVLTLLLESGHKYFDRPAQLQLSALLLSQATARRWERAAHDFQLLGGPALLLESKEWNHFIASLPAAGAALFQGLRPRGFRAGAKEIGTAKPMFRSADPGLSREKDSSDFTLASTKISASRGKLPLDHQEAAKGREIKSGPPVDRNSTIDSGLGADQAADESDLKTEDAKQLLSRSTEKQSETGTDFPLMVTHAGLILLHPFLRRLFESAGIKEKTRVELSPFVLPRASALLHFLATGQDEVYEYDVAFIKVLLGVNPETSLCVSEGLIADADKLEAEALLGAAITHWPALKDTSIAGFRTSFLQRPALLREEDNGWRLQVERQPFDMLLEHLAWSISVVKLPWMPRPLYTEW